MPRTIVLLLKRFIRNVMLMFGKSRGNEMDLRNCKKCYQMTNHRIGIDGTETCLKCGWKRPNRKLKKKCQ